MSCVKPTQTAGAERPSTMSQTDNPSLKWCLYLLGIYIFEHVKLRMKKLTGHIDAMSTGGIEHFYKLTRWYMAHYMRQTWEAVKRKVKR